MVGICSYGAYVPRHRMDRKTIFQDMGWMNPGTGGLAKGEKAVANFDEDSVTLAAAASYNALCGVGRSQLEGVYFASTTMPYKERLNAGILAGALALDGEVRTADFSGGLKAGTTALISALDTLQAQQLSKIMVAAADTRLGKPASPQEMIFGDAAAAFVVGDENVIAEFKGSYSITHDFADHYRGQFSKYDRQWEDRWIRDLGFEEFVPEVVGGLLNKYGMKMDEFSDVIYDCHYAAARKKLNKVLGIPEGRSHENFQAEVGHSGTAQSLIMLADALDKAQPGDKILVVSFGNGCDALFFEATEKIMGRPTQKKPVPVPGRKNDLGQLHQVSGVAQYPAGRGGHALRGGPLDSLVGPMALPQDGVRPVRLPLHRMRHGAASSPAHLRQSRVRSGGQKRGLPVLGQAWTHRQFHRRHAGRQPQSAGHLRPSGVRGWWQDDVRLDRLRSGGAQDRHDCLHELPPQILR